MGKHITRRGVLEAAIIGGVAALSGCFEVRTAGSLTRPTLEIPCGETVTPDAGESYDGVAWESGGRLRLEPGEAVELADVSN